MIMITELQKLYFSKNDIKDAIKRMKDAQPDPGSVTGTPVTGAELLPDRTAGNTAAPSYSGDTFKVLTGSGVSAIADFAFAVPRPTQEQIELTFSKNEYDNHKLVSRNLG